MEFEFFRFFILRSGLFLFFHNVIDGFGRFLFFALLLFRLLFPIGIPADERKFANMYDHDADEKDAQGKERAAALYGEEYHKPIISDCFCHKLAKKSIFLPVFGKTEDMEKILSEADAAEFEEFLRMRRETEAELTLKKLQVDASKREIDRHGLFSACDFAKKIGAFSVTVSPVNVSAARRRLGEAESMISCVVGGTGESMIPIKQKEAKRAVRQGAKGIRLVPCYSALFSGNTAYLKREIKKVKKSAKKCRLVLSLDDHELSKEDVERGLVAAAEGRADAVSVRGEAELVLFAVRYSAGRFGVEVSGVENAEQMRMLLQAGAEYVLTSNAEHVSEELYRILTSGGNRRRAETAERENTNKNETAQ